MNPFTASYANLLHEFESRGIPSANPSFYDHPAFLKEEQHDPAYLNNYAAFVAKRSYDLSYLDWAKVKIEKIAEILRMALFKNGRLGACVDIAGILSRILDKEEVWNCCIKGSLTVDFPSVTRLPPRYFWSVDHGNFVAGHAWVFAPPYTVVDITVRQQPYESKELPYIPKHVLSKDTTPASVMVEDVVSPRAKKDLLSRGIPYGMILAVSANLIPDIFQSFPPIAIADSMKASLKYVPVAIGGTQEPLERITNMRFSGQSPFAFYNQQIKGKVGGNLV